MQLIPVFLILPLFTSFAYANYNEKDAIILQISNANHPDSKGNYRYAFETSNAIQIQAAGNAAGVVGEVNFVSPDGRVFELTYTADENGYHPLATFLPTPPPIPDYIKRSLEYIRNHKQQRRKTTRQNN
ncbi:pupal cuticle protein Edg-78E-like [Musca domestica]|uniref:Pupal cuticle protein Edg-78E-like n=1 Tax=Musca domestica TaxID=7370 RepID=A0A9J7I6T4_MUSDO|nr:pupal cuticle protein Edg-78E-like [Musca domestica]